MTVMGGNKQHEAHHFFLLRARCGKKNSHRHGLHWDLEFPPYMGTNNAGRVFHLSIIIWPSQHIWILYMMEM